MERIRVVARVRPHEKIASNSVFQYLSPQLLSLGAQSYSFDRVFPPDASQRDVFDTHFSEEVDNVLDGFDSTIIAFGQTAAGKSYTMTGGTSHEAEGIIPRSVRRIFQNQRNDLRMTYVEVYGERLRDLFFSRGNVSMLGDGSLKDAHTLRAKDVEAALAAIRQGNTLRSRATTKMNDVSSRSHAILTLQLDSGAKLVLVDLAGSEVVKKTGSSGKTLEEAGSINKSLTSLAMVISALASAPRPSYIPFRSSKLTQLLQPSLVGNSKTTLIINCSSSADQIPESISSLRFGSRSKHIRLDNKRSDEVLFSSRVIAWKLRIEAAVRAVKVKNDISCLHSLDLSEPLRLLGEPLASSDELLLSNHERSEETGNLDQCRLIADVEQELKHVNAVIQEHERTISELRDQVDSATFHEPVDVLDYQRNQLSDLNLELREQKAINEELSLDLTRARAKTPKQRAEDYLRELNIQLTVQLNQRQEERGQSKRLCPTSRESVIKRTKLLDSCK